MKKLYILLILLCIIFTSKAQNYYPMFGYDHIWDIDFAFVGLNPRSAQNDNLQYNTMEAVGDTLIDTTLYYKAKISGGFSGGGDTTFFFREDTTAKKVWILTGDSGQEKLLYDFSLQQGDSVYLTFDFQDTISEYYDKTGWYFVDSVKTVPIYAGPRKAFFLSNPKNKFDSLFDSTQLKQRPIIEWIEQVGSTIMPDYLQRDINQMSWQSYIFYENLWDYYYVLLCSYDTTDKIYRNTTFDGIETYYETDSCELDHGGGINQIAKNNLTLQLSPNPAMANVQINSTLPHASIVDITIYTLTGEEMYSSSSYSTNDFQSIINVAGFAPGMYFIKLATADAVGMGKFVKQ